MSPTEYRPLRQERRTTLRRYLGLHQVSPGQRPQRRDLLPRADAGRGRGAAVLARRLVILASEDIGLANPNALLLANACFDTVHKIGMPEARITLAETTIYLATSPRAIRPTWPSTRRWGSSKTHDEPPGAAAPAQRPDQTDGPGYGKGYYAHDYAGHFAESGVPAGPLRHMQLQPTLAPTTPPKPSIAVRMAQLWKTNTNKMKRIGIPSHTHCTFDQTLINLFRTSMYSWHAGDIGSIELADRIAAFRPLRAVSGNIDGGLHAAALIPSSSCSNARASGSTTHIGGYPRRYDPRAAAKIRTPCARALHRLAPPYTQGGRRPRLRPAGGQSRAAGEFAFHKLRTAVRLVIDGTDMCDMERPRLAAKIEKSDLPRAKNAPPRLFQRPSYLTATIYQKKAR
ncbi:MAG: hypothetical protein V8Q54_02585 [Alistipes senegalensis]